jgi:hypothetical protein
MDYHFQREKLNKLLHKHKEIYRKLNDKLLLEAHKMNLWDEPEMHHPDNTETKDLPRMHPSPQDHSPKLLSLPDVNHLPKQNDGEPVALGENPLLTPELVLVYQPAYDPLCYLDGEVPIFNYPIGNEQCLLFFACPLV